jgi:hypothetical protein
MMENGLWVTYGCTMVVPENPRGSFRGASLRRIDTTVVVNPVGDGVTIIMVHYFPSVDPLGQLILAANGK